MTVIWAKGQEHGSYSHEPQSGIEANDKGKDFYKPDILKYHGKQNRGVMKINFFGWFSRVFIFGQ